eukprot:PLAT3326.10.p1 GENE.PLAT3326.10~~PLAT3326.10.p1  ORF type:complete len:883 (+),score=411.85 PLAT3326.10:131-2650(+)
MDEDSDGDGDGEHKTSEEDKKRYAEEKEAMVAAKDVYAELRRSRQRSRSRRYSVTRMEVDAHSSGVLDSFSRMRMGLADDASGLESALDEGDEEERMDGTRADGEARPRVRSFKQVGTALVGLMHMRRGSSAAADGEEEGAEEGGKREDDLVAAEDVMMEERSDDEDEDDDDDEEGEDSYVAPADDDAPGRLRALDAAGGGRRVSHTPVSGVPRIKPVERAASDSRLLAATEGGAPSMELAIADMQLSVHASAVDSNREKRRNTSLNTLWQIESLECEWGGDPVCVGQRVRLRHLATDCYLAARKDSTGKLALLCLPTEALAEEPEAGLFSLSPERTTRTISTSSYIRLQHCASEQWVHVTADARVFRGRRRKGKDVRKNYPLETSVLGHKSDFFAVVTVPKEDLELIVHVQSALETLWINFMLLARSLKSGMPLAPGEADQMVTILRNLVAMAADGSKIVRKCMREQRVIATVLYILEELYAWDVRVPSSVLEDRKWSGIVGGRVVLDMLAHPMHRDLAVIGRLLFRLLTVSVRGYYKNQRYLAPYVKFVQVFIGHQLQTSLVLRAVYLGNRGFLESVNAERVQLVLHMLRTKGSLPQFLEYLTALCDWNGIALPANQRLLASMLLDDNRVLLPEIRCRNEGGEYQTQVKIYTVAPRSRHLRITSLPRGWVTLTCEMNVKLNGAASYYLRFIHLLTAMARGRNGAAVASIRNLSDYSYEHLLEYIMNEELPPVIRGAFTELMRNMYVDSHPQVRMQAVAYTRFWTNPEERVKEKPADLTGEEVVDFSGLIEVVLDHLESLRVLVTATHKSDDPMGRIPLALTLPMMHLLRALVEFGFF